MAKVRRVADGVPDELVELAREHVFVDGEHIRADLGQAPLSLEIVLQRLHDSGINAGLQSFCWCGITAWIGDPVNGKRIEGTLDDHDLGWRRPGTVARWLHATALRLYPKSAYAKDHEAGRG